MKFKNLSSIVFAFILTSSSTHAFGLYISGTAGPTFPTASFAGTEIDNHQGAAKRGTGLQAEAGVSGDIFDLYVGMRGDEFPGETEYEGFDLNGEWRAERVLYGARLRLTAMAGPEWEPYLGFAVSNGATRAKVRTTYYHERLVTKQTTLDEPGTMLEAGVLFKLGKVAQAIASLQYHNFIAPLEDSEIDLPFEEDPLEIKTGNVRITFVALNLGLRFNLIN